jgi:hypothetical protein
MTLEEFAKKCGVVIMECDHLWGGTFGWSTKEHPNCAELGFKTEKAAYKGWMQQTFGDAAAKEVMKLLKEKNNGK